MLGSSLPLSSSLTHAALEKVLTGVNFSFGLCLDQRMPFTHKSFDDIRNHQNKDHGNGKGFDRSNVFLRIRTKATLITWLHTDL